jgi:hypothetical protein
MTTPALEPTTPSLFYVKAVLDPNDTERVQCTYYTASDCNPESQVVPPLKIPKAAGAAFFVNVPTEANLLLVGSVADRVDTSIIDPTYAAATSNLASVAMPTAVIVEQGVLLIFSSQGGTTQLYSSADPTVINDES